MKINTFSKTICLGISLALITPPMHFVQAQEQQAINLNQAVQIIKGDIYSYDASNISRVSVTDPAIADISDAQKDKVLLLGKTAGQTTLFIWDDAGKHNINVIVVNEDLNMVQKRLTNIFAKAGIEGINAEVDPNEGKVVLSGVYQKENKSKIDGLISQFQNSILDLTKEESSQDLIQVDMQITELSTSESKNLGIDWGADTTSGPQPFVSYLEKGVPTGGSQNWFKINQFNRATQLVSQINFLIEEGKAKDLSRPRILVTSGKEATINVGGEIPTTSTTVDASGLKGQTNITFKQYGVTLTVTPTIRNGKIDIVMNTEVSDVDKSFYTKGSDNGTNEIAYKTRTAQTQLMLDDRQTVVFAGLIRYSESEKTKRLPLVSKIPLVGALFRNKSNETPNEGKELVITLTPTIVKSKVYAEDQIKMPSKKIKEFESNVIKNGGYEKEALPSLEQSKPVVEEKPAPAATIVTPPVTEDSITENYVRTVQEKIAKAISFPEEAGEGELKGTVKLSLTIRNDGFLSDAQVIESSGNKVFDDDAITTAKSQVPYDAFPEGIKSDALTITIPIIYNQSAE